MCESSPLWQTDGQTLAFHVSAVTAYHLPVPYLRGYIAVIFGLNCFEQERFLFKWSPKKKVLTCTELRSGYKEHSVPHRHTTEAVYVRPNVHQLRAWGRGLRTASTNPICNQCRYWQLNPQIKPQPRHLRSIPESMLI